MSEDSIELLQLPDPQEIKSTQMENNIDSKIAEGVSNVISENLRSLRKLNEVNIDLTPKVLRISDSVTEQLKR